MVVIAVVRYDLWGRIRDYVLTVRLAFLYLFA